jgi:hypothetical protein
MNSLSTMFLVLSHEREGPLRYLLATRFETMPSSPSSAAVTCSPEMSSLRESDPLDHRRAMLLEIVSLRLGACLF